MYPHRYAEITPEEPPPPYEHQQMQELPALSIHELPDQRILAPELEGQHGFAELESPMDQPNDESLHAGLSRRSYSCSSESNEHVAAVNRMAFRRTPSFEAPRLLWSLSTQQDLGAAPSMTSGEQSHKSSPISPLTPEVSSDYSNQLHPNTDLAPDDISPLESISPFKNSWVMTDFVDMECDYALRATRPKSLAASSMESVQENVQLSQVRRLDIRPDDYAAFAVPLPSANQGSYIPRDHPAFAGGDSLPESYAQYHGTTNIRLGIYEYGNPLGWQYRGMCGQDATEDGDAEYTDSSANMPGSSQYTPHFAECQPSPGRYIELYDHQAPEVDMGLRADETDYPPEHCGQCDKMFSGRYRKGNLRRHVIAFHSSLAVVVGTACRICKKAYKRADATRKHEWKKHRIPDAKPKKRTK
ncbi:hypothetical protein GT037_005295 [Alternaria burnsii]|uniref:C2H2-type domain-containing protein n=1 Tax=Alternaria burnsii TaxID=1187904 RepID=A0A8H7B8M0_9PLEO|nr:uncharacterized protein GT037_005295 [Alternaria burnsii]KAF7677083.1 hypothetical protein GT037_005295 [Alternaria burnsii]